MLYVVDEINISWFLLSFCLSAKCAIFLSYFDAFRLFSYFCPAGAVVEQPCPVGTYSPMNGLKSARECKPCTPGEYCGESGLNVTSGNCSAGFYCKGNATIPTPANDLTGWLPICAVFNCTTYVQLQKL